MSEDMSPCPFCGSDKVDHDRTALTDRMAHEVQCHNCLAVGPPRSNTTDAIAAWNERHTPALCPFCFDPRPDVMVNGGLQCAGCGALSGPFGSLIEP